ncbi:MAG: insulinase family protein [Verrucomicrobiaceae bacterium]|nr:insulinase family protein [Verrucomicrobiaceae bacterium]
MKKAILALLALVSLSAPLCALAPAWPQEGSDLKPDPKAKFGRLENGFRYVILPNDEPPGRASLRLYMDVGSLMEADDQQGMAHFLEHMAFNGTKGYPESEDMVEYFQRLGMSFGGDTNAHTSFRETVYQLEIPKVDEKYFADAIKLFRDYLDGMLLKDAEIDKERGIILSEKLSRDSVEYRTMLAGFKFAMPDALVSRRMPIGLEDTIKSMKRPRFADLYETYYTPRRAVAVIVGDIKDPAMVEKLIVSSFQDAKPRRKESPDPDMGRVTKGRGIIAMLHHEKDSPATDMSIELQRPSKQLPDTAVRRRELLVRDLADSMINTRFSKLAKEENSPIMSGESYSYEYLDFVEVIGVQTQCKPEKWKEALAVIEQEQRRALQFGFTDSEFEEAKASVLKKARLSAEQASTRQSKALSTQIVSLLAAKRVFTHPAAELPRIEAALKTLKKDECLAAFRKSWDSKDLCIFIGGNLKLEGDSSAQILAAYRDSNGKPVAAPKNEEQLKFAYTGFGPEGKVAKRDEVKDLEITQLAFENNVRLNVKHTPFQKNAISVLVNFGGGKLSVPKEKAALIPFAQSNFQPGGLVKHSVDEIRRIFASKTVSAEFAVGDEAFLMAGRTTPADLEAQMQLLAAYFTAPGYRDEAERQFRKNIEAIYTSIEHTAEGVMTDKVSGFIHSDDPRFGFPDRSALESITTADLKQWLAPALKEDWLEISLVGDVDLEKAVAAVAKTFGALPKRAEKKPAYTEERKVGFPSDKKKDFRFTTEIPKAIATIYWPTEDMSDIKRTRRLILLGAVLDDRLRIKVREELGETYSPACYHVANDTFKGYGYMTAMIECKPGQAASIGALVIKIADELATKPITDDEFDRAKKPQLEQLTQMRRDNRYWGQNVLRCAQEHPERIEWSRSLLQDFSGIEKKDLEALARTYLPASRAITVNVIPEEAKKTGE